MKQTFSILSLLLLCSMVAFADNRVVIANDIANNVTISGIEGNVVTLTVTPAAGQHLGHEDDRCQCGSSHKASRHPRGRIYADQDLDNGRPQPGGYLHHDFG